MTEFNSNNQYGRGRQMKQRAGQMWTPRRASGDGSWNPQLPFSQPPPPFNVPPPPHSGSSPWMSGPRPQHCVPPPPFPGPHPPFSGAPRSFSSPPSRFSGPRPLFGGQSSQNSAPPSWNSRHPSSSPDAWSGSGAGQFGGKRRVNDVWSDPNLLSPNQRTFDGPQNRNGQPYHNRGGRGGRGMRGKGRGRGSHQFQQDHNSKNNWNFMENNNNHSNDRTNSDNSQNNNSKKKKEKVDKRDLPENNKYHCEVCDRGFKTEEKYEEHVGQHIQCSVAGCRYIAAPKLVQLHYFSQHKTGMAKKIWSLESPEAVRKWIEDRKRNFPTKENIARKEKERAERRARGEVIENKQFGKIRGRGRGRRGHHWGRGQDGGDVYRWERGQDRRNDGHEENLSQPDRNTHTQGDQPTHDSSLRPEGVNGKGDHSQESAAEEPKAKKLKLDEDGEDSMKEKDDDSRDPLSLLISGDGDSDSDDSSDSESGDDTSPTKPQGDGLTSLIAAYDDSAKEDGEMTEEEASTAEEPKTSTGGTAVEENVKSDETVDEVVTSELGTNAEEPSWIRHNKRRRDQKYRNNTLLERLLVNEIRHERNVLLQCVHYIVKNNFLGILDRKTEAVGK